MPLFFLVCGVAFLVSALRGTQAQLIQRLETDFTGKPNFLVWCGAVVLVGALGYLPVLKPLSNGFLALIFVSLIVSNKGVIESWSTGV